MLRGVLEPAAYSLLGILGEVVSVRPLPIVLVGGSCKQPAVLGFWGFGPFWRAGLADMGADWRSGQRAIGRSGGQVYCAIGCL